MVGKSAPRAPQRVIGAPLNVVGHRTPCVYLNVSHSLRSRCPQNLIFVIGKQRTQFSTMTVSLITSPITVALRAKIEGDQRDVEEKFYKSVKNVTDVASRVATEERNAKCVMGEPVVKVIPPSIQKEHETAMKRLAALKANEEKDPFAEHMKKHPMKPVRRARSMRNKAQTATQRPTTLYNRLQELVTEVGATFNDDKVIEVASGTVKKDDRRSSSVLGPVQGFVTEVFSTFDDDDDEDEQGNNRATSGKTNGQHSLWDESMQLAVDVASTFDEADDSPAEIEGKQLVGSKKSDTQSMAAFSLMAEIRSTFDDDEDMDLPKASEKKNHLMTKVRDTYDDHEKERKEGPRKQSAVKFPTNRNSVWSNVSAITTELRNTFDDDE